MWWSTILFILLNICDVNADIYFHVPRGSNNRLAGEGRARGSNNRMFDSQNNNRGGYNVGGEEDRKEKLKKIYEKTKKVRNQPGVRAEVEETDGPAGKMKYYAGSIMQISWTNQHQCGGVNAHCELILQYMCSENLRDGFEDSRIPDVNSCETSEDGNGNSCETDRRYGMHEDTTYYTTCKNRKRNVNIFTADENLNGYTSKYTRQNRNGNRNGYECPEERDYYPYWAPTPWIDIAVMTNDLTRCDEYKEKSENVQRRSHCKIPENMMKKLKKNNGNGRTEDQIPITEEECKSATFDGQKGKWVEDNSRTILQPPKCILSPQSRDNHNGNGPRGFPNSYNWTMPNKPHTNCALRIRYNISTLDVDWSENGVTEYHGGIYPFGNSGCWTSCGEKGGICEDFCGRNGYCCRNNYPLCTHTQQEVALYRHTCVRDSNPVGPYRINNNGCWSSCGKKGGKCTTFCGPNGYCCRKGFPGCTVSQELVARSNLHSCVRDPTPETKNEVKVVLAEGCKWTPGLGGSKTEVKLKGGTYSKKACFDACMHITKDGQNINGATFRASTGSCWCEILMSKINPSSGYETCFLDHNRNSCEENDVDFGSPKCSKLRCNGNPVGCCTPNTPCGLGDGDCDIDGDCAGSLVCGKDNCPWDDRTDCCKVRKCYGQPSGCCEPDTPCDVGEGDCDVDSDCKGSLICGTNNCVWGNGGDCCKVNPIATAIGGNATELKQRGYLFKNNPTVTPLKIDGSDLGSKLNLRLAINTAQVGRTFEDRSHAFSILQRPNKLDGKTIYNMEVQGKRGNIVQVFPAVEYDYGPNRLEMEESDYVHIQWTGSDRNPKNNAGNGKAGTDRSNMVLLREQCYPEGEPNKAVPLNLKNGHWGRSYPANLSNADDKTLLGLALRERQYLAFGDTLKSTLSKEQLLSAKKAVTPDPVCENTNPMKMECTGEETIRVTFARYGRISTEICKNSRGFQGITDCYGRNSLQTAKKICDGEKKCSLHARNSVFGDPCNGVYKYLEATYKCIIVPDGNYKDLDDSPAYVNLEPQSLSKQGEYKYMCTRNNDFSNRSQKGKITVLKKGKKKMEKGRDKLMTMKEYFKEVYTPM